MDREDKFSYALYIDDLTSQQEMLPYKLPSVTISMVRTDYSKNLDIYRFEVLDACKKLLPPNVLETSIELVPLDKQELKEKDKKRLTFAVECMYVDQNKKRWIEFSVFTNLSSTLSASTSFEVHFLPNTVSYQAAYKALQSIKEKSLQTYFGNFEKPLFHDSLNRKFYREFDNVLSFKRTYGDFDLVWYNKNIASNMEQKLAIKNIINGTAIPYPYCIFGPPGKLKLF